MFELCTFAVSQLTNVAKVSESKICRGGHLSYGYQCLDFVLPDRIVRKNPCTLWHRHDTISADTPLAPWLQASGAPKLSCFQ